MNRKLLASIVVLGLLSTPSAFAPRGKFVPYAPYTAPGGFGTTNPYGAGGATIYYHDDDWRDIHTDPSRQEARYVVDEDGYAHYIDRPTADLVPPSSNRHIRGGYHNYARNNSHSYSQRPRSFLPGFESVEKWNLSIGVFTPASYLESNRVYLVRPNGAHNKIVCRTTSGGTLDPRPLQTGSVLSDNMVWQAGGNRYILDYSGSSFRFDEIESTDAAQMDATGYELKFVYPEGTQYPPGAQEAMYAAKEGRRKRQEQYNNYQAASYQPPNTHQPQNTYYTSYQPSHYTPPPPPLNSSWDPTTGSPSVWETAGGNLEKNRRSLTLKIHSVYMEPSGPGQVSAKLVTIKRIQPNRIYLVINETDRQFSFHASRTKNGRVVLDVRQLKEGSVFQESHLYVGGSPHRKYRLPGQVSDPAIGMELTVVSPSTPLHLAM